MKLSLLLALLVGTVSARHLRADTFSLESPRGEESLSRDGEAAAGALMPLREEAEEEEAEGGSGSEDGPEEEGAVESSSELEVEPEDVQCPGEEDTVRVVGSPACKTCRYVVVRTVRNFNNAQYVCRRCYRGNLASIHSFTFNFQVQSTSRVLNAGQIWIGGRLVGGGRCKRFLWVDRSPWNFAYWAAGQPWGGRRLGRCVTLCTRGGHWRRSHCVARRPFVCSY